MRYASGPQHGAYPVVMHTGLRFDSIRLARVDAAWRYRARVHEYLAPPEGVPNAGLYRSPAPLDVRFNATDGPRRHESQHYIARILSEDLARNPNDTRSIFYLARTHAGLGNHSAAVGFYRLLAERSTWPPERYHGALMAAVEARKIAEGAPGHIGWRQRQSMLLDAFAADPTNMDALHALAQDHFDNGRPHLAYVFALRMVSLPLPAAIVAIENVLLRPTKFLYDYEGHRLLGFAARAVEEWGQCVDSFRRVLAARPEDNIVRDRIVLCEAELAKKGGANAAAAAATSALAAPPPPPQQAQQPAERGPVSPVAGEDGEGEGALVPRIVIPSWVPPGQGASPAAAAAATELLKRRRQAQRQAAAGASARVAAAGVPAPAAPQSLTPAAGAAAAAAAAAASATGVLHAAITEDGRVQVEVSLRAAVLFLVVVLGGVGALVLRHVCAGSRKLKV